MEVVKSITSTEAACIRVNVILDIPMKDNACTVSHRDLESDALRVKNEQLQKKILELLSQAIEKEIKNLDLQAELEEAQREVRVAREENSRLKNTVERMKLKIRNDKTCPQCARTFRSKPAMLSHLKTHRLGRQ